MNIVSLLAQVLPLLGVFAVIGAAIYAFRLLVRFVKAHERMASALEALSDKRQ